MIDYSEPKDILEIADSKYDDFYQAVLVEEDWDKMIEFTRNKDFADWILEEDVPDPNSVICTLWAPEEPIVLCHKWFRKTGRRLKSR